MDRQLSGGPQDTIINSTSQKILLDQEKDMHSSYKSYNLNTKGSLISHLSTIKTHFTDIDGAVLQVITLTTNEITVYEQQIKYQAEQVLA